MNIKQVKQNFTIQLKMLYCRVQMENINVHFIYMGQGLKEPNEVSNRWAILLR